MITLAVVGVLLTVGMPSMRNFAQNNRLSAAANDLLRSLQLGRTEAINRQSSVIVCASSNPTATNPTCSYSEFRGWIVAQDTNGNWQVDSTEPVIERHELIDSQVIARTDANGIVSYNASGFANPAGAKTPSANVVFCDKRGIVKVSGSSLGRAMLILPTGRARVSRDDGEVNTSLSATGGTCP